MITLKKGLQISITPAQLRMARRALEPFAFAAIELAAVMPTADSLIGKACIAAKEALDDLPLYLSAYLVDDGKNQWWYAAPNATATHDWFSTLGLDETTLRITQMDPDELIVVRDNQNAIGPMQRTAEDWANDRGEPYIIASTVETPVTFGCANVDGCDSVEDCKRAGTCRHNRQSTPVT